MKKKTEIQQIDFYGILSEESTPLPNPAPVPTSIVQPESQAEHLDLDIRSQINGYLNSVEKNQAREIIGHEHIPLRSIRVPIVPKLSSAWAPNGYGKTYIFTHMQDLSNSFKGFDSSSESLQDYTSILQQSWTASWLKLYQENVDPVTKEQLPTNMVPYHSMGFMFQNEGSSYAMILLFTSHFSFDSGNLNAAKHDDGAKIRVFLRPLNTTLESEDEFDYDDEWNQAEEGWAYLPSKEWIELYLNSKSENNDVEYQTIAIQALREFVNMSVIYHETPALSERYAFRDIIKSINKENKNDYNDQWDEFAEKFSHPTSLKKYDETITWEKVINDEYLLFTIISSEPLYFLHATNDTLLVDQLEYLAEYLDFLTNPMIMHSESFDEKSAKEKFESVLNEEYFALDVEQMNGFTPVLEILAKVRRILFTKSSHNQHLRRRLVHQLLMDIEAYCAEKGYVSHPLRTMLDVMLMDYDYQFGTPESEIHSPTRSTAYSDFCLRRKKNPNSTDGGTIIPPVFDAIDNQPSGFYIEGTVPIFQNDDRVGFVDLWPFCFDPDLPNGLKLAIPPETSALATNEWMRTWMEYLIREELKDLRSMDVTNLVDDHEIMDYDNFDPHASRQKIERFFNVLERYLDEGKAGNTESYAEAIDELESRELLSEGHRETLWGYFYNLSDNVSLFVEQNVPDDMLIEQVFSSSKIPLKENPFLLQEEINRCLNPVDVDAPSPWGIETKIEFENGPFRVNFQPNGQDGNTILPKHLSFGMRSEITLQFMLSQFTYECRRRGCENESGFNLLVVDEPEIGRAEHWVNLLIARLRRLHAQLSDDLNGGVLMVSHRSKVLEQASHTGGFTLMQKIPMHIEEEMDDEW